MATYYGVSELRQAEDWKAIVGQDNWVQRHSAYELAHKWQGCVGFPSRVKKVLGDAGEPFASLSINYGMVELPTFLDTFKAPSRTDIMLHCCARTGETVIVGVEGKARESFAASIDKWVCNGKAEAIQSRVRRLKFLSGILGVEIPRNAKFGYQLVHRAASVVSECILHGAQTGVVLVHSFSEKNPQNWSDFVSFAKQVGIEMGAGDKDVLTKSAQLGPKRDVAIHLAWVTDQPGQQGAQVELT